MIAFDTDVFTEILAGNPSYSQRAATIPRAEQTVAIVVIEEILRGRLNAIRRTEAGKSPLTTEEAYGWLAQSIRDFQRSDSRVGGRVLVGRAAVDNARQLPALQGGPGHAGVVPGNPRTSGREDGQTAGSVPAGKWLPDRGSTCQEASRIAAVGRDSGLLRDATVCWSFHGIPAANESVRWKGSYDTANPPARSRPGP